MGLKGLTCLLVVVLFCGVIATGETKHQHKHKAEAEGEAEVNHAAYSHAENQAALEGWVMDKIRGAAHKKEYQEWESARTTYMDKWLVRLHNGFDWGREQIKKANGDKSAINTFGYLLSNKGFETMMGHELTDDPASRNMFQSKEEEEEWRRNFIFHQHCLTCVWQKGDPLHPSIKDETFLRGDHPKVGFFDKMFETKMKKFNNTRLIVRGSGKFATTMDFPYLKAYVNLLAWHWVEEDSAQPKLFNITWIGINHLGRAAAGKYGLTKFGIHNRAVDRYFILEELDPNTNKPLSVRGWTTQDKTNPEGLMDPILQYIPEYSYIGRDNSSHLHYKYNQHAVSAVGVGAKADARGRRVKQLSFLTTPPGGGPLGDVYISSRYDVNDFSTATQKDIDKYRQLGVSKDVSWGSDTFFTYRETKSKKIKKSYFDYYKTALPRDQYKEVDVFTDDPEVNPYICADMWLTLQYNCM